MRHTIEQLLYDAVTDSDSDVLDNIDSIDACRMIRDRGDEMIVEIDVLNTETGCRECRRIEITTDTAVRDFYGPNGYEGSDGWKTTVNASVLSVVCILEVV